MSPDELLALIGEYGAANRAYAYDPEAQTCNERAELSRLRTEVEAAVRELHNLGQRQAYADVVTTIDGLMESATRVHGVGYGVILANVRGHARRRATQEGRTE